MKHYIKVKYIVIVLLTIISLTFLLSESLRNINRENTYNKLQETLITTTIQIEERFFKNHINGIKILSKHHTIKKFIVNGSNKQQSQLLANIISKSYNADLVYILNTQGTVILSTTYKKKSLLGKNYFFRPYFKEALKGKSIIYPAVGITTGKRGIYFSAPIKNRFNKVMGVAVIKASIEIFEKYLSSLYHPIALVSTDNIIFLSNNKKWLLNSFQDLKKEDLNRLYKSRQFGLKKIYSLHGKINKDIYRINDEDFFYATYPFSHWGWKLYIFDESPRFLKLTPFQLQTLIISVILITLFVITILFLTINIKRRKDAERDTLKREQQLNDILINSIEGFIQVDIDTKIIRVNPAMENILSHEAEELNGTDFFRFLDKKNKEIMKEQLYLRHQDKKSSYELKVIDSNKDERICLFNASPMYDEKHNITGSFALVTDITSRKKNEEILNREKRELSVTLNSIGEGVISTDNSGKIVFMNGVAQELTGWTYRENSRPDIHVVYDIYDEESEEHRINPYDLVITTEMPVESSRHSILVAQDQSKKIIIDSCSPLKDEEDHIIGTVLVFRDMTERLKMETEIGKIQKLESLGVLAGGIAHDFNNILTAILGNLNLSRMDDPRIDNNEFILDAEKACLNAQDLTRQLMTFSRGGAPVKEIARIENIVKEISSFLLRGSSITVDYKIPDDLWAVEVDTGQIGQVFSNIILNARQAMDDNGTIIIEAKNKTISEADMSPLDPGFYITISVKDSGPGILQKDLKQIFDPYFSTRKNGSGLGLTSVYSIIKRHNGHITAESEENKGSLFTLFIPAADKYDASGKQSDGIIIKGEGTVLLMDDDLNVLKVTSSMLLKIGYDVITTKDGKETIKVYKEYLNRGDSIDAVLLDLTIPGGMGGAETMSKLLDIDPDVKAIVYSGYSNDEILSNYQIHGFKNMMTKPFTIEELSKKLKDLVLHN